MLWALIVVLVGLVLWYGWRLYQQMARARELAAVRQAEEERESVAARVSRLLAEARSAESAGDHRLALRLYFWALVVGLSGKGRIEYRDAWTGREMLERTHLASQLAEQLRPLVREVDSFSFGGGAVAAEDSARMAAACREWLKA
jgi:type VI protein secretion system component VasK